VGQESLLPARRSSPEFQRYPSISEAGWEKIARPPEPRNPAANGKGKGKGKEKEKVAHKRQISEAIPAMNATTESCLALRRRQQGPRKAPRRALASQAAR
jgi:hypothetical protein